MKLGAAGNFDDERPSLWRRFRFFEAGRVPDAHLDWARRQFDSGRWLAFHVAYSLACLGIAVFVAWTVGASLEGWPYVLICVAVATPLGMLRARRRVRASFRLPPASDVLRSVGEASPPGPAARLPLR
ncbi:MAG: hypothetical protein M3271_07575 [Actinomycetota bacterium]|nr:hypothetical protein [Actinomycetota bacterium]